MKKNINQKIILTIMLMLALIVGVVGNLYAIEKEESSTSQIQTDNYASQSNIGVSYNTHVQNLGWEPDFSVSNGNLSGTSGLAYRLEGIKIKLNNPNGISIRYQTHIQNIGWTQGWVYDGEMAGTSGLGYRLEGIKIELLNTDQYSVQYRVHVQNIGWQNWVTDGEMAGTSGLSYRLEAIQIKIVPKVTKSTLKIENNIQDKYYKDTTINISGWRIANVPNTQLVATLNGNSITGITDVARPDIIQQYSNYKSDIQNPGFKFSINTADMISGENTIKIDLKLADGTILKTYTKKVTIDKSFQAEYYVHAQNIGWQDRRMYPQIAGSIGANQRIEALAINLINKPDGVGIEYKAHVQNIGWQGWTSEGNLSGTVGYSYRLEAIKIRLTGTDAYSIQYRVHVQNIGWQEWCYDGESAGTFGLGYRIEAIQIQIVPKISKQKMELSIDSPVGAATNEMYPISGWMMTTMPNSSLQVILDGSDITSRVSRTVRNDVLNVKKGYGDEDIYNSRPGYVAYVDFSQFNVGTTHTLIVRGKVGNTVIQEKASTFVVKEKIYYATGIYGYTGLKLAGDGRGSDLQFYQYGTGPNVLFATFAIHGFEDLWAYDGQELVQIANNFYQTLINSNDANLAKKWTIYIFPGVNVDGLKAGWTNNGPGRTTLYSDAPGHKGIDLNRCWPTSGYTYNRNDRNYNGTAYFQAPEARYLRDFLINHKSQSGQTLLVDLHGWMNQVIGDPTICSYYSGQFAGLYQGSVGKYGTGFLINWARSNLGSSTRACKSALIELPESGVTGHQAVVNKDFSGKYIQATLNMLRNMNV